MPILTKKPNGTSGGTGSWAASAGTLVSAVTDGNDATYVDDGILAEVLNYTYETVTGLATTSRIFSVIITTRLWNDIGSGGSVKIAMRFEGVDYLTPTQQPGDGTYADYVFDATANFNTGSPGTVARWNASLIGAKEENYVGSPLRVVEQSAAIDVHPMAGGLIFLMLGLGPLIAVGLHEIPKVAAAVFARTGIRIVPREYEQAWRELREYRFPRSVLVG